MKKISSKVLAVYISLILVLLAVVTSGLAFAQTNQTYGRDRFLERVDNRLERKQDVRERIATRTAQLREERIARLKKVFERILDRFRAALDRLDKIVAKIERRMDKLDARGVDTSAARAQLAACANKKSLAEAAIDDSKAKVAAIDPASTTVREAVGVAVDALHSSKKALRDYHKCLVDVTKTLKASKKEGTGAAE